jgi:molybdate transport system regulatory protein
MDPKTRPKTACIQPRIRIISKREVAIGPGKAELLALVDQTGSIGEAARRMRMSYMRAWLLIQTMNASFKRPLVATARGGPSRGGSELTNTGKTALALYQKMEAQSIRASQKPWKKLQQLLRG